MSAYSSCAAQIKYCSPHGPQSMEPLAHKPKRVVTHWSAQQNLIHLPTRLTTCEWDVGKNSRGSKQHAVTRTHQSSTGSSMRSRQTAPIACRSPVIDHMTVLNPVLALLPCCSQSLFKPCLDAISPTLLELAISQAEENFIFLP